MPSYAPILILGAAAFGFGVFTIVASYLLGRPRPNAEKSATYECGVPPVGNARERFSVKFYMTAISFIVFDVEVVFFYPWAVKFRDLGWPGLGAMMFFAFLLAVGLLYEWRKGALEWD